MSAIDDYLQLVAKGSPLNNQWQQLKHNISQNIPSTGDLRDPSRMQQWATSAALNAPMMGSIRRPQDMVLRPSHQSYSLIWPADPVRRAEMEAAAVPRALNEQALSDKVKAYFSKTWATDADPLVKYIDQGGTALRYMPKAGWPSANVKGAIKQTNYPESFKPYTVMQTHELTNTLRDGGRLTPKASEYIDNMQKLADHARATLGTNQIATTPAGKFFENVNDIVGLGGSTTKLSMPRKSSGTWASAAALSADKFAADRAAAARQIIDSPYYKANKGSINILRPDNSSYGTPSFSHISDVTEITPRMSLVDAIRHTATQDEQAAIASQKARDATITSEAFKLKEPVHQFDDGSSWNKLTHHDALEAEGKYQGHCVGTYCDKVNDGSSQIYSLRDANNKPLLTAEWSPARQEMVQVKGRFNAKAPKELGPHVKALYKLLGNK